MVERAAEAIRDGRQAAAERHMAEIEMEQALIRQEQRSQPHTGVPIVEQADGADDTHDDGANAITAGQGFQHEESGGSIVSPGAGTDPSETQTSHGDTDPNQLHVDDEVDLEPGERTFEGDGRHSLDDQ
ncbi:MAG: hypothetical protein KDC46_08085 [Thermoleophilia bacterium]|nr:hypothetical protein [Thermoleophilia bacterium]